MKRTHPLFSGGIGKWDGIPDSVVIAVSDFAGRVLSEFSQAALYAGQPIARDGQPASPEEFGAVVIDTKESP